MNVDEMNVRAAERAARREKAKALRVAVAELKTMAKSAATLSAMSAATAASLLLARRADELERMP